MIVKAVPSDAPAVARLARMLWPSHDFEEMVQEFTVLLANKEAAVFLLVEDHNAIGFAQCQLRHDYVEGTATSPVGYLEGVFVEAPYRRSGYGGHLIAHCEEWARQQGCTEFASDCELTNRESLAFHLHTGFQEANRIIHFTKSLS